MTTEKKYIKPLKLGSLELESNVTYSPLAGCSDLPYRQISKEFRPGLFFCEMVKMDALIRNDIHTMRILDYSHDLHPIGAQLCGSRPEYAAKSAKIIEDLGFDVVDLNCGCPVDKVTKDGSGSGLLKSPNKIGDILSNIIAEVKIPVTVKIRIGWDDDNIVAPQIVQIAEEAGAKAIFVHGRTREQAYRGLADRNQIKECKKAAKSILVFGNGDIFSPESAKHMFDETGCDGVLISRGTLGKPWIASDILSFLRNLDQSHASGYPLEPTNGVLFEPASGALFEKEVFYKHFSFIKQYQNPKRALVDMRKIGCWYLKGKTSVSALRESINRAKSLEEVESLLATFDWQEA